MALSININIKYKPGRENVDADWLERIRCLNLSDARVVSCDQLGVPNAMLAKITMDVPRH